MDTGHCVLHPADGGGAPCAAGEKSEEILTVFYGNCSDDTCHVSFFVSPWARQLDEIYARQTYDRELQEFLKKQEAVEEEYQRRLEEKLYEARDEAEGLKEEQQEEEKEEGEDSGISEIHIEIGEQKED